MSSKSPDLPPQILKAAQNNELIIFIGAGASKLCGSPDWRGFASKVVAVLQKKGILNFIEAEQLNNLSDARRTLSVAMNIAKTNNIVIDYDEILHKAEPDDEGARLYEILSDFNPIIVTTNYDKWLHKNRKTKIPENGSADSSKIEFPGEAYFKAKYYKREHLTTDLLTEKGAVIHLHGSYIDAESMIISLRDYIRHYADEKVTRFLSHLFTHCTVLFLGYGLGELEILDHIVRSNDPNGKNSELEPKHFILYPTRSTDSKQNKFTESYFRDECRVALLNYEIDQKGYGQIVDVLESWSPEIKVKEPTHLDYQETLKIFIENDSDAMSRQSAINLVLKQPYLTSFFLNSINSLAWFDDLENADFFKPQAMPLLEVTEEADGTRLYEAPRWPALRYLENIVREADDARSIRIRNIIRTVTNSAADTNADNWRVWATCATILSLLPLSVIELEDINLLDSWLKTRFNADFIVHNLSAALLPRLLESSDMADANKALLLIEKITVENPNA